MSITADTETTADKQNHATPRAVIPKRSEGSASALAIPKIRHISPLPTIPRLGGTKTFAIPKRCHSELAGRKACNIIVVFSWILQSRQFRGDMATDKLKKNVGAIVFFLGSVAGLAGCAIYPMAVFTVGANDSSQEVWGLSLVFLSLFPTCILALRFRLAAGCMMLFVPCYFIYSEFVQRAFMINVRSFPQPPIDSKQIIGSFILTWPYVVLGTFAILTSVLRWPTVFRRPTFPSFVNRDTSE